MALLSNGVTYYCMGLERFKKECPGLSGSLHRLYGEAVAHQVADDYCRVADRGGNDEYGVQREEGVSFNPRVARLLSIVIQECGPVDARMLRVATYAALPVGEDSDAAVPIELSSDVAEARAARGASPSWIKGLSLALVLDRVRHLHMSGLSEAAKLEFLDMTEHEVLNQIGVGAPEELVRKVAHGLTLQRRKLNVDN